MEERLEGCSFRGQLFSQQLALEYQDATAKHTRAKGKGKAKGKAAVAPLGGSV